MNWDGGSLLEPTSISNYRYTRLIVTIVVGRNYICYVDYHFELYEITCV